MIKLLVAFSVLIVVLVFFYGGGGEDILRFGGDGESVSTNYLQIGLSAFALLTGIVFGSLHRLWRERKSAIQLLALKQALRSPELWRSLLLSPLLFSGAYTAAQAQPDYILAFVVAFQTGFFCEAVLQQQAQPT